MAFIAGAVVGNRNSKTILADASSANEFCVAVQLAACADWLGASDSSAGSAGGWAWLAYWGSVVVVAIGARAQALDGIRSSVGLNPIEDSRAVQAAQRSIAVGALVVASYAGAEWV